jgi:hypothetical protein
MERARNMIRPFLVVLAFVSRVGSAQQSLPPVHPIGRVLNTSTEPLSSVAQVIALPGGWVIVHDLTGRRIVMFDSTFTKVTVIADSTSATGMAYGSRLGGLIAYRGDSTLFVDPQSISMLVIDPNGKIVRTMAAPLPNEVNQLIGGQNGTPGFDGQGRLVYRAQFRFTPAMARQATSGSFQMPQIPESSFVVRVDLRSRKVDTAATFRIPKINVSVNRDENTGRMTVINTLNPMPWTDDWALLSDGTLAVVRGQDYRVDLVSPDGKMTSAPKLPFDWQRLSDEDKVRIIDSTRAAQEALRAAQLAAVEAASAQKTDTSKSGARQRPSGDGGTIMIGGPGGLGGFGGPDGPGGRGGGPPGGFGGPGGPGGPGGGPVGFTLPPAQYVTPSEMPDYVPAFKQGAARGDADGNLWIRTSKMVNGGTVYDVISGKGELTDRVLIPPGRVIAGFGPGGTVYMGVIDGMITRLERARRQ